MNDQQPGFANQATYYGDSRPINTDPREQPGYTPPVFNTDPREQPQWQPMPAPIMARPPQTGRSPWFWMGVSVVILVVIFGGLASASALLTHTITQTKTFNVGSRPGLVLTNNSGDVHIVSGPAGQITVVARQRVFIGSNDPLPVQYTLDSVGDTLTVSADNTATFVVFSGSSGIDFDVTVPSQTILNVQTSSGDITAQGVTGKMFLTTSSGDITTNGGSGQITLGTDSGDIHASNISGQMTLTTSSGSITATNASASGASIFQTDSGDIHFSGSLADTGTDRLKADSGSITLTLSNDTAFQVQASTDSGNIHSEFAGVNVSRGDSSGASAIGRVGSGSSFAQVTIQTDSGDINLHRA